MLEGLLKLKLLPAHEQATEASTENRLPSLCFKTAAHHFRGPEPWRYTVCQLPQSLQTSAALRSQRAIYC